MTENERDEYENELDALYDNWLAAAHKAKQLESGPGGIMEMKQTIADKERRIEKLEAAILQCESIVEQYQKENERDTEWKGSKMSQMKARAVASRCGMLLGHIRKHTRKALEGKDEQWAENYGQGSEPWLKDVK